MREMSRRLLLSVGLAAVAVAAALVQATWMLLFLDDSPDPLAYAMGLLTVVVVPLAMTSAGAVLLPRRIGWLRWSGLPVVGLVSLAVALGVAAGLLADDLVDPRPSSVAVDGSLSALVLAFALVTTIVFFAWTSRPAVLRALGAVVIGFVVTGATAALIASVLPLWAAAVTQLVLTIAYRKRIASSASLGRAA
jgi:hypothetical protein